MADLPNYLMSLEQNLSAAGAKVLYAETAEDVVREIEGIVKPSRPIFMGKNECLDQMGLGRLLKGRKMNLRPVRLENFPYNLLPEPENKIVSRLQTELRLDGLEEEGTSKGKVSEEQVFALKKRKLVNEMFADSVALTGADFLVCDPGCAVLLENDGTHLLPVFLWY